MGLDITIKKFKNIAKYKKLSKKHEDAMEKIYTDYESSVGKTYKELTKKDKKAIEKLTEKYAKENKCNDWGEPDGLAGEDFKYEPKEEWAKNHLFASGYFRSSYNSAGFNSVLPQMLGKNITLYSIFDKEDNDEYYFTPDWEESLKRVKSAIRLLKSRAKTGIRNVMSVTPASSFDKDDTKRPKNKVSALKIFEKHLKQSQDYCYSNYEGEFFIKEPLTIEAIIKGVDFMNNPCIYAVYKVDDETIKWYEQALLIVKENIENVLLAKEPSKYVLCWSA